MSLIYDIVKAHGGQLNVQSREGEGSEFNIVYRKSKDKKPAIIHSRTIKIISAVGI